MSSFQEVGFHHGNEKMYCFPTSLTNHGLFQVRHKEELDQIRSAGHDALAVIVEEYKV